MALEGGPRGPLADPQESAITSDDGRSVTLPAALVHGHHLGVQTLEPLDLDEQELEAPAVVNDGGDVIVRLYPDEAATLRPGAAASFVPGWSAAPSVEVRLVGAAPSPAEGPASREVRFRAAAPAAVSPAGAVGRLRFSVGRRRALVVPLCALIESPEGPYVLTVSTDRRTFTLREVEVGRAYPAFVVVLAGAHPGDRIAVMDAFFIDAERRLRSRSSWRPSGPEAPP
jgi:multidrug efflux pump subunit AcrA (membrane-fusion protein)